MSTYTEQANEFLQKTHATISIEYMGLSVNKNWNETDCRDLYEVTLSTSKDTVLFNFWDSIRNTKINHMDIDTYAKKRFKCTYENLTLQDKTKAQKELAEKKKEAKPTAYDVLACMTTYDPGLFADFCSEFGYNKNSRRALNTYLEVQEEYAKLKKIFTAEQIEELREIQ